MMKTSTTKAADWDHHGNPRNLHAAAEDGLVWLESLRSKIQLDRPNERKLSDAIFELRKQIQRDDWRPASNPPAPFEGVLVTDGCSYSSAVWDGSEWLDANDEGPLRRRTTEGLENWCPSHWRWLPNVVTSKDTEA